ncbi:hypothetical protein Mapa_002220 [Marchantia paleacea]|nr:hypothetical protein Mapa_002220 [Marchantia paleacea]
MGTRAESSVHSPSSSLTCPSQSTRRSKLLQGLIYIICGKSVVFHQDSELSCSATVLCSDQAASFTFSVNYQSEFFALVSTSHPQDDTSLRISKHRSSTPPSHNSYTRCLLTLLFSLDLQNSPLFRFLV